MIKLKEIFRIAWLPVVFSSLCCLSPLILVMLGFSTVSFAASLADTLYGDYKWFFRVVGLFLLSASLLIYFRKFKGVCTLDQAKRKRNEILNIVLIVLISAVMGYIFFLYVVVEILGKFYKIW